MRSLWAGESRVRMGGIRRNSTGGFGLVELIIAMGLVGILALALSSLMNMSFRATKQNQSQTDLATLRTLVLNTLTSHCRQALGGVSYDRNTPPTDMDALQTEPVLPEDGQYARLLKLLDAQSQTLLEKDKRHGSLQVRSLFFRHKKGYKRVGDEWVEAPDYTRAEADLTAVLRKDEGASGGSEVSFSAPVTLDLDTLRKVTQCGSLNANSPSWNCPGCATGDVPVAAVNNVQSVFEPSNIKSGAAGTSVQGRTHVETQNGSIQFHGE